MSNYVVNDETIRLNREAADLAAKVNKVSLEARELAARVARDTENLGKIMWLLGSLEYQQTLKEQELAEAVEQG